MALMWDFDHGKLPINLAGLFTRCKDVHTRELRNSNKNKLYAGNRCNNRYGYDAFRRYGVFLLNKAKDLPFYGTSNSKASFLQKYKCAIFDTP